jgi:hypothetical protein
MNHRKRLVFRLHVEASEEPICLADRIRHEGAKGVKVHEEERVLDDGTCRSAFFVNLHALRAFVVNPNVEKR